MDGGTLPPFFWKKNQEQKKLEFKGRKYGKNDRSSFLRRCTKDSDECWPSVHQLLSEGKWEEEQGEGWGSNNIPVSELISATMTG